MVTSVDTEEMIASMEGLRLLPDTHAAAIQIAKKRGIKPVNKVQLVHGIGCVVAVLREVAGELERRMREFEAEES